MPAVSGKQYRAMQSAAHGKSNLGIPKDVAEEFIAKTPAKKRRGFARLRPDNK